MLRPEDAARRLVVTAYQEGKQDATHPMLSETLPLGVTPLVQARLLARHLRTETQSYAPFPMK